MSHEWFDSKQIAELLDAAVSASIPPDAGLRRDFVATLITAATPMAQLESNLREMNAIPALVDGSVPFRSWLEAARALAGPRPESKVFSAALTAMDQGNTKMRPIRRQILVAGITIGGVVIILSRFIFITSGSHDVPPSVGALDQSPSSNPTAVVENTSSTAVPQAVAKPIDPHSQAPITHLGKIGTLPSTKSEPQQPNDMSPALPSASLTATSTSVASFGSAVCRGSTCTLFGQGGGLLPATRVCLDAPASAVELAGRQPRCTVDGPAVGNSAVACTRSDRIYNIPLKGSITWFACR